MIEVTKRYEEQFPVGIKFNDKPVQKLTLKAAKELLVKLDNAVGWAVLAEEVRIKSKGYSCEVGK
jgi:hypothetical protein